MDKSQKPRNPGNPLFRGSWSGYERDCLFHNPDGPFPRFFNTAYLYGLDFSDDGRAAVPVDIDGDGDLDLALEGLQGLRLMENTSPPRRFARVRLRAKRTSACALGAFVRLSAGGVTQQDYVRITEGFLAQVPLDLHFGLADAAKIDALTVTWPSGATQEFGGLPADRLLTITEGSAEVDVSELPKSPAESRPARTPALSLDIELERLDGGRSPVAVAGKPLVLNFWSPACTSCNVELPGLAALHSRYGARAAFAGICVATKDPAASRDAARKLGLEYSQYLASEAVLRNFFGPDGRAIVPSTFVFDATGRLRRVFRRPIAEAELEALLDSFLRESVSATALHMHCESLMASRHFEEAEACLRKSVAAAPERPGAHYLLGECLMSLQRPDEAILSLKRSIALDPGHANAHINLGICYQGAGREAEAISEYEAALALKGDDSQVLLNLSAAALKLGRFPQARDAMARAAKADPDSAAVHKARGKLHAALGELAIAREAFRRALELEPADEEVREVLSRMSPEEGR